MIDMQLIESMLQDIYVYVVTLFPTALYFYDAWHNNSTFMSTFLIPLSQLQCDWKSVTYSQIICIGFPQQNFQATGSNLKNLLTDLLTLHSK